MWDKSAMIRGAGESNVAKRLRDGDVIFLLLKSKSWDPCVLSTYIQIDDSTGSFLQKMFSWM